MRMLNFGLAGGYHLANKLTEEDVNKLYGYICYEGHDSKEKVNLYSGMNELYGNFFYTEDK